MCRLVRVVIASWITCAVAAGCRQPPLSVQARFEIDPSPLLQPFASRANADQPPGPAETCENADGAVIGAVSTVSSPEKTRREICLAECVALALENGRTGTFFDRAGSDRRTSAQGLFRQPLPSAATDSIRVVSYDPALLATEIEESLAKFDAVWQNSLVWNRVDQPSRIANAMPTALDVLNQADRLDQVQFRSAILKPLPTGGVAGITFRTDYENNQLPPGSGLVNPAYRSFLDFTFEQPLLQGAGVFINQIRDNHPGSLRNQIPTGGRVPGILLTRLVYDQAQLEFERRLQELLFAVEEAYWELYCAYWDLYSRDSGMRLAQDVWQRAKARYEAGGIGIQDLAQIEVQYQLFRTQRLEALGNGSGGRLGVLEAERRLRYVIGLPAEDGTRLIPSDEPVTTPFEPDWLAAMTEATALRPELLQVRQDIRAAELNLRQARNLLLPDLRLVSRLSPNGLGTNFGSSLSGVGEFRNNDFELGLQMQVPIGVRAAHAEVERARLQLGQRFAFLRDQESKIVSSLQRSYRSVVQFREEVRTRHSQRVAAGTQLQALYERFKAGDRNSDILVRTQQIWADALRDEYVAVCNYNVALADFERQKGTILRAHNVTIAQGPFPQCARERPSEHIREFQRGQHAATPAGGRSACPDALARTDDTPPALPDGPAFAVER
jgi:outer membrane protein TolC